MIRILPDSWEIKQALKLTIEDDFSYFTKYDDLSGILVKPVPENPAIADSCYISRKEVFR